MRRIAPSQSAMEAAFLQKTNQKTELKPGTKPKFRCPERARAEAGELTLAEETVVGDVIEKILQGQTTEDAERRLSEETGVLARIEHLDGEMLITYYKRSA